MDKAPKDIAWLHDRMPLVVPPDCVDDWLDPSLPYEEVRELLFDVIVDYSWGLHWQVRPITPLPSGRNANRIPEPLSLQWWTPAMANVMAAIHHATADANAPASEAALHGATGMEPDELVSTLKDMEQRGIAIRQAAGWTLPAKMPRNR